MAAKLKHGPPPGSPTPSLFLFFAGMLPGPPSEHFNKEATDQLRGDCPGRVLSTRQHEDASPIERTLQVGATGEPNGYEPTGSRA